MALVMWEGQGISDSRMRVRDVAERLLLLQSLGNGSSGQICREDMQFRWMQRLRTNDHPWSPARSFRAALRVMGNLGCQLEILRLIRHPLLAEVLPLNPRFAIKFAADDYLAKGLSVADRTGCFLHHYNRLLSALPDRLLRQILHRSVPIFQIRQGDHLFRVMAHLSRPWDKEGELSFDLELDGIGIYVLSFSIVPGPLVNSAAPEVVLISRLQGMKGKYGFIQRATKTMNDVAPASFLLAALQGFAESFGISEIVGVSAVRQSGYSADYAEVLHKSYDGFFLSVGAVLEVDNLFRRPIPVPEKPLQEIKRGHKLRTKEKRALKRDVADTVRRFFNVNRRLREERLRLDRQANVPIRLLH